MKLKKKKMMKKIKINSINNQSIKKNNFNLFLLPKSITYAILMKIKKKAAKYKHAVK